MNSVNIEELYTWSQSIGEIEICAEISKKDKKSLIVDLKRNWIRVSIGSSVLLEGKLFKDIVVDDCNWYIEEDTHLFITLEKSNKKEWWSCLIEGGKKIDTTKLVPEESSISDFKGPERSMIEKMMYEQRMKMEENQK
eukprot:GHVP01005013.1.p1 GENE.GHVP01005013.1~~GHVP01005013.1.p1  ORF type:complete len:138 (+),score=35.97 GHVP01005013.1:922-1335(+)